MRVGRLGGSTLQRMPHPTRLLIRSEPPSSCGGGRKKAERDSSPVFFAAPGRPSSETSFLLHPLKNEGARNAGATTAHSPAYVSKIRYAGVVATKLPDPPRSAAVGL